MSSHQGYPQFWLMVGRPGKLKNFHLRLGTDRGTIRHYGIRSLGNDVSHAWYLRVSVTQEFHNGRERSKPERKQTNDGWYTDVENTINYDMKPSIRTHKDH
ncbi:hypothetical protein RUM43_009515 [Polyplax serrata]|uniref:Uncharacterized protein n=1 Tax=Polyplax serrata TaxID=468196 RepID=A0AAN8PIJ5_POLSC